MNNSKITSILLGVTAVSAIVSILLVGAVHAYSRQLAGLRNQVIFINNSKPLINRLAFELNQYAKKNPSLDPILISSGIKAGMKPAAAPATKPAAK